MSSGNLFKILEEKQQARAVVSRQEDSDIAIAIKAIREKYRILMEETSKAVSEAQRNYEEALDQERLDGAKPPYPEGTIMVSWVKRAFWHTTLSPTNKAVIQIYRKGDLYPFHVPPLVGTVILRFLNKDGRPGKDLIEWREYLCYSWFLEGVDPNAADERRREGEKRE